MKKYLAVLLALLLLCAAAPLALASEMYDTYGDMDDWDDEVWTLSDEWSEEEWLDYWQGAEEAYQQERDAELKAERQALGLPNPDGVNVKLNDSYLTFANSWPLLVDGYVYLPVRDFLTACGIEAAISYDAATGVAHAVLADGRELTATLGEDELLAVDADGEEYSIYTYNPPCLIDGVFHVEEEELCLFLGLDSCWDYYQEILYIVDSEALITQLDKDFSIYNRLFGLPVLNRDMQQSYRIKGSATLSGTVYGDEKNDTAQAVMEYGGLIQGQNADVSYAVKLDLDQFKDTFLSGVSPDEMLMIKALANGQARMIINAAEEKVYLQSNLLTLLDKRVGGKDWLQMGEYSALLDMAQTSYTFMEYFAGLSIGQLIYDNAYSNSYYSYAGGRDFYATALNNARICQSLLGDANFKQESRGGYTVYTLKSDQKQLQAALEESGVYWPGGDVFGGLFGYYGYYDNEDAVKLNHTLTFREKDGKIADLQMEAGVQSAGYLPVSYKLSLEYSGDVIQANFEIKARYGGKISFDFYQQLLPVKENPATAPPDGSKIVTEVDLDSQRLFW